MNLTLLIFYTVLALGVSFLCSILEAVVLSIPNTQVAVWEKMVTDVANYGQN